MGVIMSSGTAPENERQNTVEMTELIFIYKILAPILSNGIQYSKEKMF